MLLRLIGMLLVVAIPSVSSAQIFARGRVVTRVKTRTREPARRRAATKRRDVLYRPPSYSRPSCSL